MRVSVAVMVGVLVVAGCSTPEEEAAPVEEPVVSSVVETTTSMAPASTVPVGPGAWQVVRAFQDAGLDLPEMADNREARCDPEYVPCVEWVTTGVLSIAEWESLEDAARGGHDPAASHVVVVGDRVTVAFQESGSTPVQDRAAYEAVLAGL